MKFEVTVVFALPSTNGTYLLLKIEDKCGIFTVPAKALDIHDPSKVEVPGGGTLIIEKSPFDPSRPIVTTACEGTNWQPKKKVPPKSGKDFSN